MRMAAGHGGDGHTVSNPALPDDDFDEAVRIAQAEFDRHKPDVVVGSSRGGAVAMNINAGDTPLVLLCPAWKRWGSATKVKPGTVILHSKADDVVPFADSEELLRSSGLPESALIVVGTDHRLADPDSLKKMSEAVARQAHDMPISRPRHRRGSNLMYQSHLDNKRLFSDISPKPVEATQNVHPIPFDDLQEMHQLVWDLAAVIVDWKPVLVPFFATGGIPYLLPVMHVLEKQKQRAFIDGQHFHMYPGLAWGGTVEGVKSSEFFASSFGEVIRLRLGNDPVRILVIDTTNTGNAVNNAVAACQRAVQMSGASPNSIELRVIGIVNSSHSEAQTHSDDKLLVTGTHRVAHVLTPTGFTPSSALLDRKFTSFACRSTEAGFRFQLTYWLADHIPTEDEAELIGVEAVHETLATSSQAKAGRLKVVYGNGQTQQGTSLGSLPGQLISLLSLPIDAWQWNKMREINESPQLTVGDAGGLAELAELSQGGLRLFEMQAHTEGEVVNSLLKIPRLLLDVEVYWLGTLTRPPRAIARKVRDSLAKGSCSGIEALRYFRRAFPDLAISDPGGDESAEWWNNTIDSLPKASLSDTENSSQTVVSGSPDTRPDDSGLRDEDENGMTSLDDLALEFVLLVGGIEEARQVLSKLKSSRMSLAEIAEYLERTWPVTADKALTFKGPTDEQAALDFILECGGWDQANACLEAWILHNSGRTP